MGPHSGAIAIIGNTVPGRYEKDLSEMQMDTFKHEKIVQYVIGCFIRGLCLERLVNPDELIDDIFEEFVRIMEAAFA